MFLHNNRSAFYLLWLICCFLISYPVFSQDLQKETKKDTARYSIKADTTFVKKNLDTVAVGESKSGYEDLTVSGGVNTVDADLKMDDIKKDSWFNVEFSKKVFDSYYDVKRFVKKKINIALGTDYMFLYQFASFSYTNRQAASGIFRFYGTWRPVIKKQSVQGAFIFKIENRHKIGVGELPRNLGYAAGAALSTASFKDFGWGLTNLYWKQHFDNLKYEFVVGIIDPGDWLDLYPLLNPFKFYLNEAFFNSPAMALPNQGLGFVFSANRIISNLYMVAGIQDANGQPTKWLAKNFQSFFKYHEYMTWVEVGWNPDPHRDVLEGRTIHLMYWHQAARTAERAEGDEVEESWGLNFSASQVFNHKYTVFLRAGYAVGNGATMRHLVHGGFSYRIIRHDQIGFGLHWGAPNDRTRPNQTGFEVFYALQLTDNLNIMPDIQLTFNPSFNDEKNVVGVFSVFRLRYAM